MPFENEHAARIRVPGIFNPKTFKRTKGGKAVLPGAGLLDLPKTISIIWAKIKGRDKEKDEPLVQSLRFPVENWTEANAKKWLKDKKVDYLLFEKAKNTKAMEENEILLYTSIWGGVAEMFIEKLNQVPIKEDVTIRSNCPGGSVFAGWGMITKMQERQGKVNIKVDGHAASMGMFMLLFADYVEAIKPAQIMIHRATGYVENEDDQKLLDGVNKDLRKALEAKIDQEKLKEISGVTLDDIFNGEKRRDIWLTADEAKKIGLINKVVRIEPNKLNALSKNLVAFGKISEMVNDEGVTSVKTIDDTTGVTEQKPKQENKTIINQNSKKMTLEELKAQHPALYAQAVAEGEKQGVKAERVRVKALLAFIKHDNDGVIKMIKEGTEFTPDVQAELLTKMTAKIEGENIEDDNPKTVTTTTTKTPEALKQEEIAAEVKKVNEIV